MSSQEQSQKKTTPITQEQKQALWALFRTSNYAHDALPRPGHDAALDALAAKLQLTYTQCARQYGIIDVVSATMYVIRCRRPRMHDARSV